MIFSGLCPPALIYLIYSVVQIGIDIIKGYYNTGFVKVWVAFIFTILLNYLCQSGLGIISWIIIFIPFVLMTVIVAVLLFSFGLSPKTGKLLVHSPNQGTKVVGGSEEKKPEENTYGIDNLSEPQDVDQLLIQQNCESGKNKDRKYCAYTEIVQNSDKRRTRYVRKVRDILVDMDEADHAGAFMNQCDICISEKTDIGFEDCFIKKSQTMGNTIGGEKGKQFIDKLKENQLI